ncbi:PAS domain-containing protein [Paenibacillus sp. TRM 82003]|nr:PAS domain-containing protein [Paenibacillus sp. TRM 82003]
MTIENRNESSLFVVGIGASAGGLEALHLFFDHMKSDTSAAFVIIQHLSPNYKSFMAELLAPHTKMKIHIAEHDMALEPNNIYLIPARKNMTLQGGKLQLSDHYHGLHLPIDIFFHSLAIDRGSNAIGVILSGTGSDGSKGIASMKENGALILAQDDRSAKFDGMPKSAMLTGLVDNVLSPAEMSRKIVDFVNGEKISPDDKEDSDIASPSEDQVAALFAVLKEKTAVDFKEYKRASILRRIERRMALTRTQGYEQYIRLLENDVREISLLHKDLLIGVTHFFRDTKAFEAIEERVIPHIFNRKKDDKEIRVWVAGCSTGEEAYSLAMLLTDHMERNRLTFNVKIFATDLDKQSIQFAGQGVYPASIAHTVPPRLLHKYFSPKQDTYIINEDIRKKIIFAPHNIIKDPPFINMDLITCRNMLIYLQPKMQQRVISLFHFALNPKSFLFLGPSETIGRLSGLFTYFDKKWNIFQQNESPVSGTYSAIGISDQLNQATGGRPATERSIMVRELKTQRKTDDLYNTYIEEHFPPSIVLDEHLDIVHMTGNIDPFISMSKGKPSLNVHRMFHSHLSVAIVTALHKVRKDREEIVYRNFQTGDPNSPHVDLTIRPFSTKNKAYEHLVIVLFEKPAQEAPAPTEQNRLDNSVNQRVIDLEQELLRAEETLQITVEELETSNEELQATNEELVAANEELQSANEELQSVNEELMTVNGEYQMKIQELTELNNDMDNFLSSTKIGTIFLDTNMCVRRFTPAVTKEIHLLEIDIGRPISHIKHHFDYDDFLNDAKKVLQSLAPVEKEVYSTSGRWYSMRILPYRTAEQFVQGTVITFVDITEMKTLNNELQIISYAIDQSPSIVVIADLEGRIEYANPKSLAQTQMERDDIVGRKLSAINRWDLSPESYKKVWSRVRRGHKWTGQLQTMKADGTMYWEELSLLPIHNSQGEMIHVLKVAEDITDQKTSEELLRKSEMLSAVGQLAAGIAHEIRNPLTSLKGFTKLIGAGKSNARYLEIMSGELERIEAIISELLMLSKQKTSTFLPNEMNDILTDVKLLLDTQAILNNVAIVSDLEDKLPPVICNENELKQVFINIMKNAIESMPQGGKLQVKTENFHNQKVRILFQDEGVGIPKDTLARLGEPFFTTKDKGTGLGLMICYQIIESVGGTIRFSSDFGLGTTVEITLPAYNNHVPDDSYSI